ncbi:ATP-grasp fold amidoligase family protein [Blastochloris tepida]|uniref:Glycosyl transferase n=1 Tax=Blastochloris tepida TaxID=2233851 RepID=A0A348G2U5_9HYPH|nr:ATP-grasp fold amidoligase family protein [Blastochloris tepida]BBF93878.1 hypothetical protein BLTE_25630 [Blastochloris tepida]
MNSLAHQLFDTLPSHIRVPLLHLRATGKIPNIFRPRNLNDLHAWRKLNIKRGSSLGDLLVVTGSKLLMRDWVSERGLSQHLPDLIEVLRSPAELAEFRWTAPCVLKAAHGSAMNAFLQEEPSPKRLEEVKRGAVRWFDRGHGHSAGEWWYGLGPRAILVEGFFGERGESPPDYKFFCIRGEPQFVQVDHNRHTGHRRNLFLPDWTPLNSTLSVRPGKGAARPEKLSEMLDIAKRLSEPFDLVRIDLYHLASGRILIGEITHSPGSGWEYLSDNEFSQAIVKTYYRLNPGWPSI